LNRRSSLKVHLFIVALPVTQGASLIILQFS